MRHECVVYRLTSPSGKRYIGVSTKGLKTRMYSHLCDVRHGRGSAIHKAIRKYGIEQFTAEVVFTGTVSECFVEECRRIKAEQTKAPQGYNLTDGGEGSPGVIQTSEAIEKRRAANKGRKRSPEFSARLSAIKRGVKKSQATVEKLKVAAQRRISDPVERARLISIGTNHPPEVLDKIRRSRIGKKHSTATREKMSEAQRTRQSSPEFREAMRKSVQDSWAADPERRKRMSDRVKQSWVVRKAKSEGVWE